MKATPRYHAGIGQALTAMREAATDDEPLAIYYAYKQSEIAQDGIFSPGWTSFLQAVVDSGLAVDGTWPVRTELSIACEARLKCTRVFGDRAHVS
jgi:putative DNA methylase